MDVQKQSAASTRKGDQTRSAILDAAEREFAAHGYDAVSMRQIAEGAGQLVGSLTYYFTNKEALFTAVVTRRADELKAARRGLVEGLVQPGLEDLVAAFLQPLADRIEAGDPKWRSYARILSQIAQEARWAQMVDGLFGEASRDFIRRLREAEPELSLDQAIRGYAHLISVMVGLFAASGLLDRLSNSRLESKDVAGNFGPTVRFLAGGLRASIGL